MNVKSSRILLLMFAAMMVVVVVAGCAPADVTPTASTPVSSGIISPQQYTSQFAEGGAAHQLVDVRTPEEFASGHLANAVNIPLDELPARLDEFATDQPVVLYCRSGNRSGQAAQILASEGYTQVLNLGGIIDWQAAGLPVVQ